MIRLGPFDLIERLARGGMGEVWRGQHRRQGLPVAVKVLHRPPSEAARAELRREARAMASLVHPRVVVLLDYLVVDLEAAASGALVVGAPALAMELGDRTLSDWLGTERTWPELLDVLLQTLDALAHAHALSLVHRDLKPGNVLQFGSLWKLTDFGIATAMGEEARVAGTPYYMAPEQILGLTADIGPWTDLYALACLAWRMTAGRPPFTGEVRKVLGAQVRKAPPVFRPRGAVPKGLVGWLLTGLQKDIGRRFPTAASAAWGIAGLGAAELPTASGFQASSSLSFTLVPTTRLLREAGPRTAPFEGSAAPSGVPALPPLPTEWRVPSIAPRPAQLLDAGLGLYGLRRLPMVGRETERDVLWGALVDVKASGQPRCVLLEGLPGTGKTRLAEWISERAHELGAAIPLRAMHESGESDALSGMLGRYLGASHRSRRELALCAAGLVGPGVMAARLTELVRPLSEDEPAEGVTRVRLSVEDRLPIVLTALCRLAARAPLVVWLDDAHWSSMALELAGAWEASPILFVLTLREDIRVHDAARDDLRNSEQTIYINVAPLASAERYSLVQELLGLEPTLATRVADRAEGNPLFAVHLVGSWIQKGLLQVGDKGWEMRPGEAMRLPEAIHDIWCERLSEALPAAALPAIELAAVLGRAIDPGEWQESCAEARTGASVTLLEQLELHCLVSRDETGWRFVHGLLVRSLLRMSEESGRLHAHQRAAAISLLSRGLGASRRGQTRLGWQTFGRALSLEPDEPLRSQLRGELAYAMINIGEVERGQSILAEAIDRLRECNVPETLAAQLFNRSTFRITQRDFSGADRDLTECEALGLRDPALVLVMRGCRARLLRQQGERVRAREILAQVSAAHEERGEPEAAAMAASDIAEIDRELGPPEVAEESFNKVIEVVSRLGLRVLEGAALVNLGSLQFQLGHLERAKELYERSLAVHEETGFRRRKGLTLLNLAELYRTQEEAGAANQALEEALVCLDGIDPRLHCFARSALLQVRFDAGEDGLDSEVHQLVVDARLSFARQVELVNLGIAALLAGRRGAETEARGYLLEAASLLAVVPPFDVGSFHCRAARVMLRLGDRGVAHTHVARAVEICAELGAGDDSPLGKEIEAVRRLLL